MKGDPVANPVDADAPAILVVDDQPSNLLALEATLEPLRYRIVRASSGAEALSRLGEDDFVLVVMDVHMPGLDGYQTMALIRDQERSRDIPVVFLSAVYDQPEHTRRGYALGAVDYISKPFDPEVLRGKVRALVTLYTRGQRAEREHSLEAESIKGLFLGAIGHDLRNPLNAIVLASQAIARQGDCGNAQHRVLAQRIERASRRMQRMIEDILDLTRLQFAGGIPLSRRATDAADLCRTTVEEHRLAHPTRVIELDVSGDVSGHWDPAGLGRVVSNLVDNAIHHGEDGPVRVRVDDRGDGVALRVHNGGAPIRPESLATLFDPFCRGDHGSKGLGLGLFIVREIVRTHGGSVNVRSTEADGTTFTVLLPKASPR